jgi:transcriptional regulator with XRE-family HTH domain
MISNRIRQLRLARGLTMEQLAAALGVTKASVSKWELGSTHPEYSRLEQLAHVLGVTTAQLITEGQAHEVRSYPVVDYMKYDRVEHFMHRLRRVGVQTYPSARAASARAFFMRIETSEVKNLWLTGIQSGSIVLFDPEHPYTSDDLVFAHDARGDCQLMYVKEAKGVRYFQAFIGNKPLYDESDYLVILGVALESVHVTQMSHHSIATVLPG